MPSVAQKRPRNHEEGRRDRSNEGQPMRVLKTGQEYANALQTDSLDVLRTTLSDLDHATRLQGRGGSNERLEASDGRIQLVHDFVSLQGVTNLLNAWDVSEKAKQPELVSVILRVMANMINVLGSHQPNQDQIEGLLQRLLPSNSGTPKEEGEQSNAQQDSHSLWSRLQSYLTDTGANAGQSKGNPGKGRSNGDARTRTDDDVVLSALQVLLAMTTFAGSKYARTVFDALPWGMRSLARLLSMRKRSGFRDKQRNAKKSLTPGKSIASLSRPDIRTLWITVLLSFLRSSDGAATSVTLRINALTVARDHYAGMLKGLLLDPASIVTHTLMGLHDGILSEDAFVKLPRSKVVSLFNEWTCKELVKLYEREDDIVHLAQSNEEASISDVAHHFLLALCTHPDRGVCYKDNGWYGRSTDDEQRGNSSRSALEEEKAQAASSSTQIHNKILFGVLRSLTPSRSAKQSELALRILAASPELVGPYLATFTNLHLTTASISWLATSTFIGRVLSLPLPDFKQDGRGTLRPPPSLASCLDALLPPTLTRSLFVRGITISDRLMRSATLALLIRLTRHLLQFKQICQDASSDELELTNAHSSDLKDSTTTAHDDVMLGVYGVQTSTTNPWRSCWQQVAKIAQERIPDITTLLTSLESGSATGSKEDAKAYLVASKNAVLVEQTLRACWITQSLFDSRASTTAISTGDLDKLFYLVIHEETSDDGSLNALSRLHAIRIIEAFAESQGGGLELFLRSANSERSFFSILLHLANERQADPKAGKALLRKTASSLIRSTMQSNVLFEHDPQEWQAWEYALGHVESQYLLDFLDECTQRCSKTAYRYIELARKTHDASLTASPLLMCMLEQYNIRVRKGLLKGNGLLQAFIGFLHCLLPALSIGNASVAALDALIGECALSLEQSDEADKAGLMLRLNALSSIVRGLDLSREDRDDDAAAARKAKKKGALTASEQGEEVDIEPQLFAFNLASGADVNGRRIIWASTPNQAIDAKLVLQAIVSKLQTKQDPTRHEFEACLLDALGNGASEQRFLRRTIFANERLLAQCSRDWTMVELISSIITRGPFREDAEEDRELVADFVDLTLSSALADKAQAKWRVVVDLVPFMGAVAKRQTLAGISSIEGLEDLATDVLSHVNDTHATLRFSDILPFITVGSSSAIAMRLVALAGKAMTDISEQDRNGLIDFILQNSHDSSADAALCNVLNDSKWQGHFSLDTLLSEPTGFEEVFSRIPFSVAQVCQHLQLQVKPEEAETVAKACVNNLFGDGNDDSRIAYAHALACLLEVSSSGATQHLVSRIPSSPEQAFRPEALLLAASMKTGSGKDDADQHRFVRVLVEKSLLWLVRRFAEDAEEAAGTIDGVRAFIVLLAQHPNVLSPLAHLVEPVLKAAISNRLHSQIHCQFVQLLLVQTPLQTTKCQHYIDQMLHSRGALAEERTRRTIVSTVALCAKKDRSIVNATLISSLVALYEGSLSLQDRQIFDIFSTFEASSATSMMTLLSTAAWKGHTGASAPGLSFQAGEDIIWRLDANRAFETCLRFPRFRSFADMKRTGYNEEAEELDREEGAVLQSLYDPLFVLGVLGQYLLNDTRSPTGLEVVEVVRTNVFGAVICCLSSQCVGVRTLALNLVARMYAVITSATFREKSQLLLILDALRESFDQLQSTEQSNPPLPVTTTLFVAHALRAQVQPSLYLYPLISRFLLQRSTPLDQTDVPLLYGFLYASSHQSQTYRQQRVFMVRYLATCIRYGGRTEWRAMQKRHVWHSVCSMYTSVLLRRQETSALATSAAAATSENGLQRAIEDLFYAASSRRHSAFTIVVRLGFFDYIQQVLALNAIAASTSSSSSIVRDKMLWTRLIVNLVLTLDFNQEPVATKVDYLPLLNSLLLTLTSRVEDTGDHEEGGKVERESQFSEAIAALPRATLMRFVHAARTMTESVSLQGQSNNKSAPGGVVKFVITLCQAVIRHLIKEKERSVDEDGEDEEDAAQSTIPSAQAIVGTIGQRKLVQAASSLMETTGRITPPHDSERISSLLQELRQLKDI